MLRKLNDRIIAWQLEFNSSFGDDISTPRGRRLAALHTHVVDHAFLRRIWRNTWPLGAHAWRANQPDRWRFAHFERMGIRTIVNLRGPSAFGVYLFEREACARNAIALIDLQLDAYTLDPPGTYLKLLDIFDTAERPILMHCKSGADRSGLAAAFYLIHVEDVPVAQAKKQLALKYAHRRRTRAGVLDHLLEAYEADTQRHPMKLRRWLETRYDPAALQAEFETARGLR